MESVFPGILVGIAEAAWIWQGARRMRYTITIKVNAPPGQAIGIKEHLAMVLEPFGDCRVVDIREEQPEQMRMEEK